MISIIAAIGKNRELGNGNQLLWHIPDDLKRFKALTLGHPVIMGRKTFDSIGKPLPGRKNIVITRDTDWKSEGVSVAHSLEEAIEAAYPRTLLGEPELRRVLGEEKPEIFIIGGAQIYATALPHADKLYMTLVDDEKTADTFFPEYENRFTKKIFEEVRDWDGLKYTWVDLRP